MPDKIELEPGVFLLGGQRVWFEKDHQAWPLPGSEAKDIVPAYEHLIWCNREKRQRVIRCLRKALEVLSEREP